MAVKHDGDQSDRNQDVDDSPTIKRTNVVVYTNKKEGASNASTRLRPHSANTLCTTNTGSGCRQMSATIFRAV